MRTSILDLFTNISSPHQKCSLCSEPHGAKVQCLVDKCTQSFHIDCARSADLEKKLVFDTEIDTYGLHPWLLLCVRHNQKRLKSTTNKAAPPSPDSDGCAPPTPPRSETPGSSSPSASHTSAASQTNFPDRLSPVSAGMPTPPATMPTTPHMPPSPFRHPSLPSSPPLTPEIESSSLDKEPVPPNSMSALSHIVLTPEQMKIVSDFMFTNPEWDQLIRGVLTKYAPNTPGLVPVVI